MLYLGLVLMSLQAGVEAGRIQPKLGRVGFQIAFAECGGTLVQPIVIFPELALIESALAGLGGQRRFWERVGEIAPDDLELVAVLRAELFEDTSLVPRFALRSAKVAVFDERDGRGGRPEAGVTGQAGRAELRRGARPRPEINGGNDGHQPQQSRADPEPTLASERRIAARAMGGAVRAVFDHRAYRLKPNDYGRVRGRRVKLGSGRHHAGTTLEQRLSAAARV